MKQSEGDHVQSQKKKRSSYSYRTTLLSATIIVCKASFLGLHEIKESRLKSKVLNFKDPFSVNRGKHGNHDCIDDNIFQCVFDHIASFPARESHYIRDKN